MTNKQAIKINNEMTALIEQRKALRGILTAANSPHGSIKELLPADALAAYEQDEIGQAYFDFISNTQRKLFAVDQAIKALPRIPMSVWQETQA